MQGAVIAIAQWVVIAVIDCIWFLVGLLWSGLTSGQPIPTVVSTIVLISIIQYIGRD